MINHDFIAQLDLLISEYEALINRSKYDDLSDFPEESAHLAIRLQSAFDRMTTSGDTYGKASDALRKQEVHQKVVQLSYLAYAFREEVKAGWFGRVAELVRAETSVDMIEMATDLLSAGYKDAAAVIVGTATELHLRALSNKYGILVLDQKGRPKKADTLRIELRQTQVLSALQDKRICYWLGIRNEAAHGNYSKYTGNDVKIFISELVIFIDNFPA